MCERVLGVILVRTAVGSVKNHSAPSSSSFYDNDGNESAEEEAFYAHEESRVEARFYGLGSSSSESDKAVGSKLFGSTPAGSSPLVPFTMLCMSTSGCS